MPGEVVLCALWEMNPIYLELDSFYQMPGGAKVCVTCVKTIRNGQTVSEGRKPGRLMTRIPENAEVLTAPPSKWTKHHPAKEILFWVDWDISLCVQCKPDHESSHTIAELDELCKERLLDLHHLEYLAQLAASTKNQVDMDLNNLIFDIVRFWYGLDNQSAVHVIQSVGKRFPKIWESLVKIHHEYFWLPFELLVNRLVKGTERWFRDPKATTVMHWLEWGGDRMHLFDLSSGNSSRFDTYWPDPVPLFSRSIWLPNGMIFQWGGRAEANSNGLHSAWAVDPKSNWKWNQLEPMINGHSNHFICYFNNFVYVVAGWDENNRFGKKWERYSLVSNTWEFIADTNETRDSIHGALDYRTSLIYIAGGRIDNGLLAQSFEWYDISKDSWIELKLSLPFAVDMHGMVLLPGAGTRLLLFAGLDTNQSPTNGTCLINIDELTVTVIEGMKSEGGWVVNEVKIFGDFVYALTFHNFTRRRFERWSITNQEWESLPHF